MGREQDVGAVVVESLSTGAVEPGAERSAVVPDLPHSCLHVLGADTLPIVVAVAKIEA